MCDHLVLWGMSLMDRRYVPLVNIVPSPVTTIGRGDVEEEEEVVVEEAPYDKSAVA